MSGRLFAVGDVHGCAAELETLLAALPLATGDTVVFVGDYVDRGPDSARVIELALDMARRTDVRTVCLRGNHEDMCLAYLGGPGHWADAWLDNGGRATLRSWGLDPATPAAEVAAAIPPAHRAFLDGLRRWHVTDAHLVVHAGIRPGRPLDAQDDEELYWIREPFLASTHGLPQTIVFGHTPYRDVFVDLPYKVGIDTGCVYGGMLTCLETTSGRLWQVRRGERHVVERPLPPSRRRA